MTRETARVELLQYAIQGGLTEEDALLWMALLHTHEIHLPPGTLEDLNGRDAVVLPAETRRGAAGVMAALWRKRSDPLRTNYLYWYNEYGRRTPYELFDNAPPPHQERIRQFRDALARDRRVLEIRPEE
jgi:hypothetical protein